MGSLHHSKWCVRRERENHTRALARLAWPSLAGAGRGGAYMRHAREWSAEIRSVSLQERSFLLPFYFYVLADKFLISCPVSIRIRNRVGLGLWSRHNTASGPNIYTATGCGQRHTEKHLGFCLISQLAPPS